MENQIKKIGKGNLIYKFDKKSNKYIITYKHNKKLNLIFSSYYGECLFNCFTNVYTYKENKNDITFYFNLGQNAFRFCYYIYDQNKLIIGIVENKNDVKNNENIVDTSYNIFKQNF